jgi:hypothetical protein
MGHRAASGVGAGQGGHPHAARAPGPRALRTRAAASNPRTVAAGLTPSAAPPRRRPPPRAGSRVRRAAFRLAAPARPGAARVAGHRTRDRPCAPGVVRAPPPERRRPAPGACPARVVSRASWLRPVRDEEGGQRAHGRREAAGGGGCGPVASVARRRPGTCGRLAGGVLDEDGRCVRPDRRGVAWRRGAGPPPRLALDAPAACRRGGEQAEGQGGCGVGSRPARRRAGAEGRTNGNPKIESGPAATSARRARRRRASHLAGNVQSLRSERVPEGARGRGRGAQVPRGQRRSPLSPWPVVL